MTEEQKEYEMMKLVNTMDKLQRFAINSLNYLFQSSTILICFL